MKVYHASAQVGLTGPRLSPEALEMAESFMSAPVVNSYAICALHLTCESLLQIDVPPSWQRIRLDNCCPVCRYKRSKRLCRRIFLSSSIMWMWGRKTSSWTHCVTCWRR